MKIYVIPFFILVNCFLFSSGIHDAARSKDLTKIKKLINSGADINALDRIGKTPMMVAAEKGHYSIVKYLLDNGASVEPADIDGFTAFHYAHKLYHREIAALILKSPQGKSLLTEEIIKVNLKGEKHNIRFVYLNNKKESSLQAIEKAKYYLPLMAEYMGTAPLFGPVNIIFFDAKKGSRQISRHIDDTVYIKYDNLKYYNQALAIHEYTHLWSNYSMPVWLYEGIASMLPIAIAESDMKNADKFNPSDLANYWYLHTNSEKSDKALQRDFRFDGGTLTLFYTKSLKFVYLLYKELGAEGFKKFVRKVILESNNEEESYFAYDPDDPAGYETKKLEDEDIVQYLSEIKKKDWNGFFSGWIRPGKYNYFTLKDFSDVDKDGISGVDEHYIGTDPLKKDSDNDGISDGEEIKNGSDPLRP